MNTAVYYKLRHLFWRSIHGNRARLRRV
jgi:hypothetical protein